MAVKFRDGLVGIGRNLLVMAPAADAVLISDGYARREIAEALESEPIGVGGGLAQIAAIYALEDDLREHNLVGADKQLYWLTHSKPKVEVFFDRIEQQFER